MTFSALPADDCKRSSDASRTAMARLLAVAGHDLKQPLQVALMSMAGAVRDGVDSRTEQRIGTAMEALIRLECELDDIVLSSRTEHGPFPLRIKVQLGVVLDQVRSDWQLHADTCGIDIRFETPTFAADTDPRMLRTILRNLVGNVINYTSAGGHVTVACSRMADDIVIEVRDDGCGIASSRLDSVFEAFDRGGRTDRTTGSGLGLQIVRETADILQHRVSVRSIEGRAPRSRSSCRPGKARGRSTPGTGCLRAGLKPMRLVLPADRERVVRLVRSCPNPCAFVQSSPAPMPYE